MPQVTGRDLDEWVVDRLKARAKIHERSLEAELRTILREAALAQTKMPLSEFQEVSRRLRAELAGRSFPDSAESVREDRDIR